MVTKYIGTKSRTRNKFFILLSELNTPLKCRAEPALHFSFPSASDIMKRESLASGSDFYNL